MKRNITRSHLLAAGTAAVVAVLSISFAGNAAAWYMSSPPPALIWENNGVAFLGPGGTIVRGGPTNPPVSAEYILPPQPAYSGQCTTATNAYGDRAYAVRWTDWYGPVNMNRGECPKDGSECGPDSLDYSNSNRWTTWLTPCVTPPVWTRTYTCPLSKGPGTVVGPFGKSSDPNDKRKALTWNLGAPPPAPSGQDTANSPWWTGSPSGPFGAGNPPVTSSYFKRYGNSNPTNLTMVDAFRACSGETLTLPLNDKVYRYGYYKLSAPTLSKTCTIVEHPGGSDARNGSWPALDKLLPGSCSNLAGTEEKGIALYRDPVTCTSKREEGTWSYISSKYANYDFNPNVGNCIPLSCTVSSPTIKNPDGATVAPGGQIQAPANGGTWSLTWPSATFPAGAPAIVENKETWLMLKDGSEPYDWSLPPTSAAQLTTSNPVFTTEADYSARQYATYLPGWGKTTTLQAFRPAPTGGALTVKVRQAYQTNVSVGQPNLGGTGGGNIPMRVSQYCDSAAQGFVFYSPRPTS